MSSITPIVITVWHSKPPEVQGCRSRRPRSRRVSGVSRRSGGSYARRPPVPRAVAGQIRGSRYAAPISDRGPRDRRPLRRAKPVTEATRDVMNASSDAFAKLKMRGEEARARLNYGRTAYCAVTSKTALKELNRSLKLFTLERNNSGPSGRFAYHGHGSLLESGRTGLALDILGEAAPIVIRKVRIHVISPPPTWLEGEAHPGWPLRQGRRKAVSALAGSERAWAAGSRTGSR